jgi:hypothetical protein
MLLGLTQSIPNSFMGGMQMAQRRAQAAAEEKFRRDQMGLQAKQFNQKLPGYLSGVESRALQAKTAAEIARLRQQQYESRDEDRDAELRVGVTKAAAGKMPTATGAMGLLDPNANVAGLQDEGYNTKLKNSINDAAGTARARKAQELWFLEQQKKGQDAGTMPKPATRTVDDVFAIEDKKHSNRKEIDAAKVGSTTFTKEGDPAMANDAMRSYYNVTPSDQAIVLEYQSLIGALTRKNGGNTDAAKFEARQIIEQKYPEYK